jgi:hypothetical protein
MKDLKIASSETQGNEKRRFPFLLTRRDYLQMEKVSIPAEKKTS